MRSSSCWRPMRRRAISMREHRRCTWTCGVVLAALLPLRVSLADVAPAWMRAQVAAPIPAHEEKTDAVEMYSETILTVQLNGDITRRERKAYRILRPDGAARALVRVDFDAQTQITSMHAWCIPAAGKDYEVREKDAVDGSLVGVENGELVSDVRSRLLRIPAATPGSVIGYEWEQVERPYVLAAEWWFQDTIPARESHFQLRLPPGWTYKATWLNHDDQAPTELSAGQWQWIVTDVAAIRPEPDMPPLRGVAGRMVVSLLPPRGNNALLQSWSDLGAWYADLTHGRRDASPPIKQEVVELTASAPSLLAKMQALAAFVQNDIRYVAIELGIGGHQPHPAAEIFAHRYGDCKDKATLLGAMLAAIGVETYYVIINTERGSVTASTPPNLDFNHVILAIALPAGLDDPALRALRTDPQLGRLLFFDPTDPLTPFGRLRGALQANYGLVVRPDGGALVELPQLATNENSVDRTAKMTLGEDGSLRGNVHEIWTGDRAAEQRNSLRSMNLDTDRIRPVEALAAGSFTNFQILKATVANEHAANLPFEWNYEIEVDNYAKVAGDLLLVRPRLLGSKASALLETREPRRYPIEFAAPLRDTDTFEISLPAGYAVDELPPPVRLQYEFGSYYSKTEFSAGVLRYKRTIEIKDLSVSADHADDLKQFYREIANDERNSAVLKHASR
jgi:transglutaminase-like putative cysteine protease